MLHVTVTDTFTTNSWTHFHKTAIKVFSQESLTHRLRRPERGAGVGGLAPRRSKGINGDRGRMAAHSVSDPRLLTMNTVGYGVLWCIWCVCSVVMWRCGAQDTCRCGVSARLQDVSLSFISFFVYLKLFILLIEFLVRKTWLSLSFLKKY